MGFRNLHSNHLIEAFSEYSLQPIFYLEPAWLAQASADGYGELRLEEYDKILSRQTIQLATQIRRFSVRTESTEYRFRSLLSDSLWSARSTWKILSLGLSLDLLRRMRFPGWLALMVENWISRIDYHRESFERDKIAGILANGVGNYGFHYEGLFAREGLRQGLKVISVICNYDNITSRGYRGFMPTCLAVWSKKMADQAVRRLGIPPKRIHITGPPAFDRYFKPLSVSREIFLEERGLDPAKKTVFYAGGVSVVAYIDFIDLLIRLRNPGEVLNNTNIIVRPYPHRKVTSWAGPDLTTEKLADMPNVYISDAFSSSTDAFSADLGEPKDTSSDELHALLRFSDLLINYFSTVSLEAAICDLPTIHIGYDNFDYGVDRSFLVRHYSNLTHNLGDLRRKSARIVKTDEELVDCIAMYLGDRTIDQEMRYEFALSECEYLDGRSSERLAALIDSCIDS